MPTRLRLYLIWLRKTYRFNWAHKPLCGFYREDVLQIGSVYLCRSCILVYLGVIVGLGYAIPFSTEQSGRERWPLAILFFLLLLLSVPAWYKQFSRGMRDVLRFMLGLTLTLIGLQALCGGSLVCAMAIPVSYGAWHLYGQNRKKRKLAFCSSCPDYSWEKVCPGYALQTMKIKEYQEEATAYLLQSGYRPRITKTSP